METLYNHVPFLKNVNERFKKRTTNNTTTKKKPATKDEKELPRNQQAFMKEVKLKADTTVMLKHDKKTKRISVTARTKDGHAYKLKYKVKDDNNIIILSQDTVTVMVSVNPKKPADRQWWYEPMQYLARGLMMIRNVSISYRNQQAMSLPGYLPNVGDMLGQRTGSVLAPGLGFAFGTVGEGFVEQSLERGWLLCNEDVSTPATTNLSNDLQVRMTLEPVSDLRIDLNWARNETRARSIQYMYDGMPTNQSGSFTMTTISLGSALEGIGDASNGYPSASFERFCGLLGVVKDADNSQLTTLNAQQMIPAFLEAYTSSSSSGGIIPKLRAMLPNWTLRYTGLMRFGWFADHFKSFNINHSYKSLFAIGSYSTPSMPYAQLSLDAANLNVPAVSLNESFAPLIGVDMTLPSGLTAKMEYRTTRVLNLSMTSIQMNESRSNDWVVGMGYKIQDFKLFGSGTSRKIKKVQRGKKKGEEEQPAASTTRRSGGVNHDLNLRLDLTYRRQAALVRDIATMTSTASSGNSAFKASFMADYTLSRLLTLSAYYDLQTNTPLLSSSSYPTTTQDFGLSLKFSLTR